MSGIDPIEGTKLMLLMCKLKRAQNPKRVLESISFNSPEIKEIAAALCGVKDGVSRVAAEEAGKIAEYYGIEVHPEKE